MIERLTTERLEAIQERLRIAERDKWRTNYGTYTHMIKTVGDIPQLIAEIEKLSAEITTQAERAITAENALAQIEDIISVAGGGDADIERYRGALMKIAHGDTWTAYPHDIAGWALGLERTEVGGDGDD